MNNGSSALQCGQVKRSALDGGIAMSPSQARHWKCIIPPMKPLIVMLMIAASVHAQSLADAARKERERQAKLRPTRVITSTEAVKPEEPKERVRPKKPHREISPVAIASYAIGGDLNRSAGRDRRDRCQDSRYAASPPSRR